MYVKRKPKSTIILPAPTLFRWSEKPIAWCLGARSVVGAVKTIGLLRMQATKSVGVDQTTGEWVTGDYIPADTRKRLIFFCVSKVGMHEYLVRIYYSLQISSEAAVVVAAVTNAWCLGSKPLRRTKYYIFAVCNF